MDATESGVMEIVDAQIHAVEPLVAWGEGFSPDQAIAASAELAVASMTAVGVSAAIVNARLEYVTGYLARHPDRFAGLPYVGWPAPAPDVPVADHLAELAATPGIIGIRIVIGRADLFRVYEDGGFDECFLGARRHGLPVFVLAHGFLPGFQATIDAFPDVTFVIDHVGLRTPPINATAGPELFDELPEVLALARHPNVAVKFTGVPSLSTEPYPFDDVWPPMLRLLDVFGVERMFWGSDFTRCRPLHTYRESVDFLRDTDRLSDTDKQQLFAMSIRRWLHWPAPSVDTAARSK